MKELQKYYADRLAPHESVYIATEADAAFAALKQQHADEIAKADAEFDRMEHQYREEIISLRTEAKASEEEIEFLTFELQRFKDLCDNHKYQDRAQSIDLLRKQAERYEKLRSASHAECSSIRHAAFRMTEKPLFEAFDSLVDQLPASGQS